MLLFYMEKIETILPYVGLECILGNSCLSEPVCVFLVWWIWFFFHFQICQSFYFASIGI